ncbi:MAG: bifunctional 5,10-methylenetetrahydrofolate dehydrogenase/5,10-methenyltetrahydrofolate cyclohydrolase [Oligoflexia bacterium]|nr:bifunctional 5,10-methylenetetrahydrofolate dehydrogenase/5,10-methenyltetrahydrofolate cyclohydrolase [Oligoflexia bacterium]
MLQILAKPVVEATHAKVKARAEAFTARTGRKPRLAVVLVGEDPASVIYTRRKGEAALSVGLEHETINFPASATPEEVRAAIQMLNEDSKVDGILIQRPLPKSFREEEVLYWVAPEKDVDAFHPINTGRLTLGLPTFAPCTPAGVMELLQYYKISVAGKNACIIGRSSIVGKPMASLLLQANATVFHCHSRTADLAAISRQADIVVAAIGKPEFIGAAHVREGAVVIDVGINRRADGKIVGDVAYAEVAAKASAITPVPGGVGPMTIAMLLQNTVWAAEQRG